MQEGKDLMKRSKAVNIIQTELVKRCNTSYSLEVAEIILEELLKGGMQPESYEGLMKNGVRWIREEHCGYDTMLVRNQWEPEDV